MRLIRYAIVLLALAVLIMVFRNLTQDEMNRRSIERGVNAVEQGQDRWDVPLRPQDSTGRQRP